MRNNRFQLTDVNEKRPNKLKNLWTMKPSAKDGYIDGFNQYSSYFVPNYRDPTGMGRDWKCFFDWLKENCADCMVDGKFKYGRCTDEEIKAADGVCQKGDAVADPNITNTVNVIYGCKKCTFEDGMGFPDWKTLLDLAIGVAVMAPPAGTLACEAGKIRCLANCTETCTADSSGECVRGCSVAYSTCLGLVVVAPPPIIQP